MKEETTSTVDYDALRRSVRLLMLLDASERAGLTPIHLRRLHTFAYLSNVLAPVWDTQVFDGRLLKLRGGPFYPAMQHDLDRLVGRGLVIITDLRYVLDADDRWRLDGNFSLNRDLASDALNAIVTFPQGFEIQSFLLEVAYAVSALSDSEFDALPSQDPTYSDFNVDFESVLDFDEWRKLNFSANATRHFAAFLANTTPGELLHMYVRHLGRRIGGER